MTRYGNSDLEGLVRSYIDIDQLSDIDFQKVDFGGNGIKEIKSLRERVHCDLYTAVFFMKIIFLVRSGKLPVTPELMQGILHPELKQILVETICLKTVGGTK